MKKTSLPGVGGKLALKPEARRFGKIQLPAFANATDATEPILGPDTDRGYKNGQVFFANASRFIETYYSEPLTNYLVGWRDPNNIEATLQFLAPAVPVNRRFEWKAAVNAEEFLSEVVDDQRAIGADFKRVVYTATDVNDKTYNRGLTMIVDLDDTPGAGALESGATPPWLQQKVAKLTRRLYRNSVRRAAAAIAASAVQVQYHWAPQPVNPDVIPSNPDGNVQQELINATNLTGIRPNRVVYGDTALLYRQLAYAAQNNPAGYVGYQQNAEASLAAALGVEKVYISRERYQSSDAAKSEIFGPNVYAFFAMDDVDTEDPSNIKRFVSTFDEEQGGGLFRVYVQQISSKLVAITVEFYEKIVVTYAGGIRQMQILNP
jgi:hypothetical protein